MVRTTVYKELDEIRAPKSLPGIGVEAGDRGTVVGEHMRPEPAIEVEYADEDGQTKALVVYSPDLEKILAVRPEKP